MGVTFFGFVCCYSAGALGVGGFFLDFVYGEVKESVRYR